MNKSDITIDMLREVCARKGYLFFEQGDYNLNLIGIRTADTTSNEFNDVLCLAFKQSGRWVLLTLDFTTDPGLYYRNKPLNVKGTAVLVADQHRGAFKLGKHQGKYEALQQAKALPVYRDNDRDNEVNASGEIDLDWHGINMHRAAMAAVSKQVGKWSAGCQVVADGNEFDIFISICKCAKARYGNLFTYTLLEEKDFTSE